MDNYNSALKLKLSRFIWDPDRIITRPFWLNVVVPLGLTIIATCIKLQCFSNEGYQVPFLLFFGVIIISASYGGTYAGIFSLIFTICSSLLVFIYPAEGFYLQNLTLMELAGFLIEALLVIGLIYFIQVTHFKLKVSEERFRGIIEKSTEGFFMTNNKGEIIYTCPSMGDILGYTEDDFKSKNYFGLLNTDDNKKLHIEFIKLLSTTQRSVIVRHQMKTGWDTWIWVETCITNLLDDSRIKAVIFHCRNITEAVNKEQQQEDFVSITSHELKTPITALKGYLQMLHRKLDQLDQEDNLKLVGRMELQIERITGLINDMLDTAKINAGDVQYYFASFNITDCIKETIDAVKYNASTHKVNCSFSSAAIIVKGDKNRIGQVITNLVTNAIKYSPGSNSIDVSCVAENGKVLVSVTDYGIGISPEKQKKIFDRFYRVDTLPKDMFQGLGLGLYITAEIIKRHNGQIGVESSEGSGSTFWFTLPQ